MHSKNLHLVQFTKTWSENLILDLFHPIQLFHFCYITHCVCLVSWQKVKTYSKSPKIWSEFGDSWSKKQKQKENNLVVASIWSSSKSFHTYMANKENETYKNKNGVVSSHINTRNEASRSVWNTVHSFTQRMRRFWLLSSAPTLILLAKAKYLRVFTCAIISVQVKGVEKVIGVFFPQRVCCIKRRVTRQSWNDFWSPFTALSTGFFLNNFPSLIIRWLPVSSPDLTWALPHPQLTVFCHVSTSLLPPSPWDFLFLGSRAQAQSWPRGWSGTHWAPPPPGPAWWVPWRVQ